jgi:hypothetical protein
MGLAKVVPLGLSYSPLFDEELLGHADLGAFLEDVVVVVDIHDKVGAVGFGHSDAFVIDQGGVFDGINPCLDGPLDGLGAVGMGRNFAAGLVGGVGSRLELFEGVLGGAGLVSLREDAARSVDLHRYQ